MAYELLGRLIWFGAKLYVRRRFGSTPKKTTFFGSTPKKVAAGVVIALAVGALLASQRRTADS